MSEDTTTAKPDDELPEEGIIEFTTREEYISGAYYSISAVDGMDELLMSKEDARRIRRIRRKCLRIIDECVNEMFDELFESDEDNED